MSTGSGESVFTSTLPDLKGLLKKLDAAKDSSNEAIRQGINKGADIILEEQKRLIRGKSKRLADAIKKSDIAVSKKTGTVSVSTGYQGDCFNTAMGGKYWQKESVGIVGLVHEFGRPGESPGRTDPVMKQTRNGKKVKVKKGLIVPTPHIRRGYDIKIGEAAEACAEIFEEEIGRSMDG